ncbi:hypothetical protein QTP70_001448 [Hemibagrus guttatus]|uniref:Reverse transcriptase domain-containing protein n=1 Tax=Hemibagrus guttatus TaxID=175788 RepID=A0AAE0UXF1_9TELE|nr:hypothetical protein QTP70_001448 [Hemibagrus guttatus]
MTGKGRELADMMERRKVDILCVQETRWKGSKARSIGAGFKLFYYGVDSKRNGVGVVLKEEFVRNVLEVKRVSDRVMSLKLEIEGVMLNVVSGYAPQVGCELEEKERFWSELDEVMESIPTGERVVIGADFNGHVGEGNTGDEEVMGKFGVKERNLEGQMVVDFAKRMDMGVVNTYFQKREEHRVTYKSGDRRTQVDYILCRRGNLKEISDCKVVVGESVARQHRMVVCRMTLMVCKTKRSKIEKKTKWWKLKKEECCEEFRQKLRQALGGQVVLPDDWETTAEVIRETGRKVLGVSSGRRKEDKETWWWNEEVQDSVQRKRLAKKKWDMDRTEENRQEYKELQRRVKREVSKAKQKAYEELYTRLDTREGEKDLYRLARQRDRDGKDVQQVRVIKDRDGRVLTSEQSVQKRWKEYFEELMNEENEREKRVEGLTSVEQKVDNIRKDEVRKALKRMKSGKAVGPDDIPVEVWKCLGEAAVEFLANLFNRVLESERMPEEWRRNLEKAYDRVPREELWYCMRKSGVAEKYVRVVQDMYERSRTVVRCAVGQTEEFNVEVGLHQGSALSPFLFAMVMDQLSEEVRQESPWTMMFADDIVICSESREQVEENLERWRFALERRGMKVSRIQSNGECGKEIKKRVQAETVSLRKRQESELEVAELKMLRFSLGVTRLDRIRNKYIRGTVHVGRLGDKVRKARLRWFGHLRESGSESAAARLRAASGDPVLDLSHFRLRYLPKEVLGLEHLERLYVCGNRLRTVPDGIVQLQGLRTLALDFNKIDDVPLSMCQLVSLTHLYLGSNRLMSLPPEIKNLQSLRCLWVDSNYFHFFPKQLYELPHLRSLQFGDNKLKALPSDMWRMEALRSLWLYGNRFTEFPQVLLKMEQLEILDLDGNRISKLPSLLNFPALRLFSYDHNPVKRPPLFGEDVVIVGEGAAEALEERERKREEERAEREAEVAAAEEATKPTRQGILKKLRMKSSSASEAAAPAEEEVPLQAKAEEEECERHKVVYYDGKLEYEGDGYDGYRKADLEYEQAEISYKYEGEEER